MAGGDHSCMKRQNDFSVLMKDGIDSGIAILSSRGSWIAIRAALWIKRVVGRYLQRRSRFDGYVLRWRLHVPPVPGYMTGGWDQANCSACGFTCKTSKLALPIPFKSTG